MSTETSLTKEQLIKDGCEYAGCNYISTNPGDYKTSDMVDIADGILQCGKYTSGDVDENFDPVLCGTKEVKTLIAKTISEFCFV